MSEETRKGDSRVNRDGPSREDIVSGLVPLPERNAAGAQLREPRIFRDRAFDTGAVDSVVLGSGVPVTHAFSRASYVFPSGACVGVSRNWAILSKRSWEDPRCREWAELVGNRVSKFCNAWLQAHGDK